MKNHFYLLFTLLLLGLSISLVSCASKTQLSQEEEKYLFENPNIPVGIYINYPPYQFINNNGEIDGILLEYFSKLEANINHTFKKKYYTNWQPLIEDAKNNKIDIILEIQSTEERRQFLTFTEPIFTGSHVIVTKHNDKEITIKDLKGKRVSVGAHFSIEEYLIKNYPDIILVPKPNEEACLLALYNDEADAFIGLETITKYLIFKEGYKDLKVHGTVDYDNKLSLAIRKGKPILADIIKKGNRSISIEEKNKILNMWLYDVVTPYEEKAAFFSKMVTILSILCLLSLLLNLYLFKRFKTYKKRMMKENLNI
ncbi:transporter substrate-binding domain-containing protein [Lacinutrix neustonica]|uniref:Transporter substrate-binding domain-containing protein n=1 Tax=Lacinutrix neustonica TaxID=2980107 RepID=A0A9E8SHZ5_9FLAO|nr:transporter substrate-binding domain-containing protein [Lacinutrix neustonica]WAC03200.1 transporter substrate-binding domain-containing protein [Lacinutrix neustonica]